MTRARWPSAPVSSDCRTAVPETVQLGVGRGGALHRRTQRQIEIEVPDGDDEDDDPDTITVERPPGVLHRRVRGQATIDTSDSLLDPTAASADRLVGARGLADAGSSSSMSAPSSTHLITSSSARGSSGPRGCGWRAFRRAAVRHAPSRRLYAGAAVGAWLRIPGHRPARRHRAAYGGRSLGEVSLEARIKTGFLWWQSFGGPVLRCGRRRVKPTPGFDALKLGAGVGVRYATGFGPLRLDVGFPLNPEPMTASSPSMFHWGRPSDGRGQTRRSSRLRVAVSIARAAWASGLLA